MAEPKYSLLKKSSYSLAKDLKITLTPLVTALSLEFVYIQDVALMKPVLSKPRMCISVKGLCATN